MDKTDFNKRPMPESSQEYYWTKDTEACVADLWDRIEEYYNEMRRTGRLALYRNSFTNFYAGWIYRASMFKSGEMGELTRSFWNHERNILQHIKSKVTQDRIAYKSLVKNSDAKSAQARELVDGLLDNITTSNCYKLDEKIDQSVEDTSIYGESSIAAIWNKSKGPVFMPGMPNMGIPDQHEGDIEYFNITPLDLIINTTLQERSF